MSRPLTLECDERTTQDLEDLRRSLGPGSAEEVVRRALGLLRLYADERERGATLVFENRARNERREVLSLAGIRPPAGR